MTTLTQTSFFSKKLFGWTLIIIAAFGIFFIGTKVYKTIKDSLFPDRANIATVAFGKIPKLDLSDGLVPPAGMKYSLETISGNLPPLPYTAKVFSTEELIPSFGDLARAKTKAARANFNKQSVDNFQGKIKLTNDEGADLSLVIDILNGNFLLTSGYLTRTDVIASKPKSAEDAKGKARTFLSAFDIRDADFPQDKVTTLNFKVDGGRLLDVEHISFANLIQVNYNRADFDKVPVVYGQWDNSEIWTLVSQQKVVAAKSYIWPVQKFRFATYPLKGTRRALEDLKAGKGVFNKDFSKYRSFSGDLRPEVQTAFSIFDVSLGYYIGEKKQEYVQPVYVFKGEKGQLAYVAAVDDAWINSDTGVQ